MDARRRSLHDARDVSQGHAVLLFVAARRRLRQPGSLQVRHAPHERAPQELMHPNIGCVKNSRDCNFRSCFPKTRPTTTYVKKINLDPKEEYPGEGEELSEALTVLREWITDVQGSE